MWSAVITDCFLSFFVLHLNIRANDPFVLELDFEPFNASFPRPTRSSSIGNGVQFLNRHLSSIMFRNKDSLEPLLDFLRAHKYKGHVRLLCYAPFFVTKWLCYIVTVNSFKECNLSLHFSFPNVILVQGLMLNDRIHSISKLQSSLAKAEEHLSKLARDTPYTEFEYV